MRGSKPDEAKAQAALLEAQAAIVRIGPHG
jgi:hypothetical protein